MIVTLTISPAVDKSAVIDGLIPEKKLRCRDVRREPGGGGINVSKALKELGETSHAVFAAGGPNGTALAQMLAEAGLAFTAVPIAAESREDLSVTDAQSGAQYRFVMPGAPLTGQEEAHLLEAVWSHRPALLVASGSLPPSADPGFYARLAREAKIRGVRLVLDTSGEPLQRAVREGVFLLKPNLSELAALTGRENISDEAIVPAAREVISRGGCETMVVSMGGKGAWLVTAEEDRFLPAPDVQVRSTVGAGDSMVAGMVHQLALGKTPHEMARFGVACGSAATMNAGTHLFNREDVFRLLDQNL
ncbi:MAG: 1-phosphofructokinase family hexose kinase [Siphonobacter aquaeclarae]|nr:1-phosphofructokinase family hexose kinase [Siphonobacter aquaeclarae]